MKTTRCDASRSYLFALVCMSVGRIQKQEHARIDRREQCMRPPPSNCAKPFFVTPGSMLTQWSRKNACERTEVNLFCEVSYGVQLSSNCECVVSGENIWETLKAALIDSLKKYNFLRCCLYFFAFVCVRTVDKDPILRASLDRPRGRMLRSAQLVIPSHRIALKTGGRLLPQGNCNYVCGGTVVNSFCELSYGVQKSSNCEFVVSRRRVS